MSNKTLLTYWELWSYDVWHDESGPYVNDRHCFDRAYPIRLKPTVYQSYNREGQLEDYTTYSPSDYQIQQALGTRAKIACEGEDTVIYVNRESDGYPLGELNCVSHTRLSSSAEYGPIVAVSEEELEYQKNIRY